MQSLTLLRRCLHGQDVGRVTRRPWPARA